MNTRTSITPDEKRELKEVLKGFVKMVCKHPQEVSPEAIRVLPEVWKLLLKE